MSRTAGSPWAACWPPTRSTAGPLTVESARWHSGRLLIRFAGVADRNQAEDLRGIWLTLDSAEAGPTGDPDEFHDHELIGLAVVTTSGEPVGRVTDVRHFGQDLLVIEPRPTDAVKPLREPRMGQPQAVRGPGGPVLRARLAASGRARRRTASCWSRSWPRSCPRWTWPRAGSSSTPRPGCSSWRPGNPARPRARHPWPDARRRRPRTRPRAADISEPGTRAADGPARRPRADQRGTPARQAPVRRTRAPRKPRPAATRPARTGPAGS